MSLFLTATTDKLQIITSAAATVDVSVSFMDMSNADPPVVKGSTSGRTNTPITTATTTDVLAAPAASTVRNVKAIYIRNKHATLATDITVQFNQNATLFELHKVTLNAGELLSFVEGVGFFTYTPVTKLDKKLRVASDVALTNVTPTYADITGLTCAVEVGKHYNFSAHLIHLSSGTTIGAHFGVGGVAMTAMIVSTIDTVTASVTASAHSAGTVAAINTAATAQTTGAAGQVLGILSGWINPSASGTFAVRGCAEVTGTVTVKAGSWLKLWEADN